MRSNAAPLQSLGSVVRINVLKAVGHGFGAKCMPNDISLIHQTSSERVNVRAPKIKGGLDAAKDIFLCPTAPSSLELEFAANTK